MNAAIFGVGQTLTSAGVEVKKEVWERSKRIKLAQTPAAGECDGVTDENNKALKRALAPSIAMFQTPSSTREQKSNPQS